MCDPVTSTVKKHKLIFCKLLFPPLYSYAAVLSLSFWCTTEPMDNTAVGHYLTLVFSCIFLWWGLTGSFSQCTTAFLPTGIILFLTPCSGCMFKPPLPSCQRWRSQGHAGSIFNSSTENFFCLFCLHIPLAQPANAAVVYWCYRQTKGRERFGNAPLLSSSLKSGSNWEIINPEIWCMTTTLFSCILG